MGGPCTVDGEERQELDNFYECLFEVDGQLWRSSEQCYQASKFPGSPERGEEIRRSGPGMGSWHEGQGEGLRPDWEEVKVDAMYAANFEKFSQNPPLRRLLCDSRGPIVAKGGLFWKTWNECLLERIREELRGGGCGSAPDPEVLAQRKASMEAYRAAAASKDQRAMDVATKYASERKPVPDARAKGGIMAVRIEGGGSDVDGTYVADLLIPEANGQPHFIRGELHLYLGAKGGRRAWVLDDSMDRHEVTGTAYLAVEPGKHGAPLGAEAWRVFDGSRHVERKITVAAVGM